VAAIEGGMSRNQAAKQLGLAISTAIGRMQRVEETGSVTPGQMGGHKPKAISDEHASGCHSGSGAMISRCVVLWLNLLAVG